MAAPSNYVHGTTPVEQDRLVLLNRLLNARVLELLTLGGDERILEVGAGTGVFARVLAEQVRGVGSVVAVERSAEQLEAARATGRTEGLELRQGDALELPLEEGEWSSFDLAHARFLLEHLRDPQGAVDAMARAVRTGGRVVLMDDDHSLMRLDPEPPGFDALWQAYVRCYERAGNDAFIGRRLVRLLVEAGLEPVRTELVFYGSCPGAADFEGILENLVGVIESTRDAILAEGLVGAADFEGAILDLRSWGERPDATVWYGVPWAEGRKPA